MSHIKVKPYEKLAFVYDSLMNHVNYKSWADYIYEVTKQYISNEPNILELAGGNGQFSNIFQKYYPNILVTDRSFMMLSYEKNKLAKVCCEMSYIPFKNKFDLVYSTFDSINYLTSKKKIVKTFREIHRILNSDGIFAFDVSLERNSLKYAPAPKGTNKEKNIHYNHLSLYNRSTRIHKNIFKIKFGDDIYKEVHRQKIYPFEIYFDLLEKAKLFVAACYESFTLKKAKPTSRRVQFIAKKINDAII
jgi:ubiquinone/menaquinone biosynthesis C-methylase UbiE